ncbi:trypsin, alkaline C-like [Melitaea cinxia]|uniref:trypsin, alkaline C-like n=1 Tax=Melitaea cinxia TaxID=113334 RepID=UPI001E273717|nr:trypsin, alkaline C-like [Melitaea cinxia]
MHAFGIDHQNWEAVAESRDGWRKVVVDGRKIHDQAWHNIPRTVRIRAGTSSIFDSGEVVYVENISNHPNYSPSTKDNDISVVRIARALPSLPSIRQAVLVAHGSTIPDNLPVELVGWGSSIVLRNLTLPTINNRSCAQRFAGIGITVTENMICTSILDQYRDSCLYNFGGPMVYQGILIGVVSECTWRPDTDNSRFPLISTSVASYTRWITDTAKL